MTVAELTEVLKKSPPDHEVFVQPEPGYGRPLAEADMEILLIDTDLVRVTVLR